MTYVRALQRVWKNPNDIDISRLENHSSTISKTFYVIKNLLRYCLLGLYTFQNPLNYANLNRNGRREVFIISILTEALSKLKEEKLKVHATTNYSSSLAEAAASYSVTTTSSIGSDSEQSATSGLFKLQTQNSNVFNQTKTYEILVCGQRVVEFEENQLDNLVNNLEKVIGEYTAKYSVFFNNTLINNEGNSTLFASADFDDFGDS